MKATELETVAISLLGKRTTIICGVYSWHGIVTSWGNGILTLEGHRVYFDYGDADSDGTTYAPQDTCGRSAVIVCGHRWSISYLPYTADMGVDWLD